MKRVFQFLQLSEPQEWDRIVNDRKYNEHQVYREPILEETETLLRSFYQPYNTLLAKAVDDMKFQWNLPEKDGVKITLRSKQIVEARQENNGSPEHLINEAEMRMRHRDGNGGGRGGGGGNRHPPRGGGEEEEEMDFRRMRQGGGGPGGPGGGRGRGGDRGDGGPSPDMMMDPRFERFRQNGGGGRGGDGMMDPREQEDMEFRRNQHGFDRMRNEGGGNHDRGVMPDEPPLPWHSKNLRGQHPNRNTDLKVTPQRFSLEGLPMPEGEEKKEDDDEKPSVDEKETPEQYVESHDTQKAARDVCLAAFTMDLKQLKHLFYDIGVPGDLISQPDGNRNAFHCLATLFTMGEAHGKSHVFAELKGRETWLTKHFKPPMEKKMQSVRSADILDHIAQDMISTAKWLSAAGVPLDAQDTGGNTPLMLASVGGELELVRFLISKGANLDIVNDDQRTALHYAASNGHADIGGLLVKAGAKIDVVDLNGVTAMDIIANPGPIFPDDAKALMNIEQRPARKIERKLHPELYPTDPKLGWNAGTGGWGPERLKGFEDDMECPTVDQYFADEITAEEIFHKYMAHNAPVLIRGLLDKWNARNLYTVESLTEEFGDVEVQVSEIKQDLITIIIITNAMISPYCR
jgi:hypothetical protein